MKNEKLLNDFTSETSSESKLSRRDALKYMAVSPIAASVLAGSTIGTTKALASEATGRIVIVGGGAGAIMALARLRRGLSNPDITIIAPNDIHLYQPGQIFIASGDYVFDDIVMDNRAFIGDDVTWIKDEVSSFDPDANRVVTRGGKEVAYDYLVVATGLQYHYEWIKGMSADLVGKHGISSVYLNDTAKGTAEGATLTHQWFNDLKAAAKNGTPKVICTQPNTPIKCGGAPQKILYLSNDYLRQDGLSAEFTFATNGGKLFGIPEVADALTAIQKDYGITSKFKHNLTAIDAQKKIATFTHTYETKGEYDKELDEYEVCSQTEEVEMAYDFIHIVPPMSAPDAVKNSPLGWQKGSAKGWLEVDRNTLQHLRYSNVFGIGDVCGIPLGKTGGSTRHHAPVMVENLIAVMEGKEPKAKFDGYTVCPLKPRYGKIMMAEFNYDGLAPSVSFLKPYKEYSIWWTFDKYMLKLMYKHLMMRGLM